MTFSNIHELAKLSKSLSAFADTQERFSLPLLQVKLVEARRSYPHDHTIGAVGSIVDKMTHKDKMWITRAEVNDLYRASWDRNSKFAFVFADELGVVEQSISMSDELGDLSSVVGTKSDYGVGTLDLSAYVDPTLSAALDQALGDSSVVPAALASVASKSCTEAFADLGLEAKSEALVAGDGFVVCAASCLTPKGTTAVLVPVFFVNGHATYPDVFVSNAGVNKFDRESVETHLISHSGEKLNIRASEVASILNASTAQEISDVDLAVARFQSENAEPAHMGSNIVGIELENVNPNAVVNLPSLENIEIARTLQTEAGYANFRFGEQLVKAAARVVDLSLREAGAPRASLAIFSSDDSSITYVAKLGSVAVRIPVSINGGFATLPNIVIHDGAVRSLDKESIAAIMRSGGFDRAASVAVSPLYGTKPSELVAAVRKAMRDENLPAAEDALEVLASCGDGKAYQSGLSAFARGLGKHAEEENNCSLVVRSRHSSEPVCGHTNLPLHKVCQDKHGNCMPISRRGSQETSTEGGSYMHSKIFI